MTDNIGVRKRRQRSTEPEDFTPPPEVQKLFSSSNGVRKRRTSATKEPLQSDNPLGGLSENLQTPQLEESQPSSTEFIIDENKVHPSLINTIDKIKTELREESRYDSDSLYSDDTYYWRDNYSESFQHFLGSFE